MYWCEQGIGWPPGVFGIHLSTTAGSLALVANPWIGCSITLIVLLVYGSQNLVSSRPVFRMWSLL